MNGKMSWRVKEGWRNSEREGEGRDRKRERERE